MSALRRRDFSSVDHYRALFAAWGAPGLDALRDRRSAAMATLEAHGFPGSRDEDWKYTRASRIVRTAYPTATGGSLPALGDHWWAADGAHRLVFVDGALAPQHGTEAPSGVYAAGLAGALAVDGDRPIGGVVGPNVPGFSALNLALAGDGAVVVVPPNTVVDQPLHIVHVATGSEPVVANLRHLVEVGRNSQVQVVEHYVGTGSTFTNAVTEVVLGDNASLSHVRVQDEAAEAFHVATVGVRQGRDSRFSSHALAFGAALSRTDIHTVFEAPGAFCELNGLYLARGKQHVDHHTGVDHAHPHGTSRELYKGIVADRAHGVFTGKVIVREGAQKTDAEQSNNNLVLSDHAIASSRPQLEIYADDVKCAHGATVGRLDKETLFYLRSRGLDLQATRELLTFAFANEIVGALPHEALRDAMEQRVRQWLRAGW